MTDTNNAAQLAAEAGIGKKRTPRSFDDILRGAKALTLKERVDLVNALTAQNKQEAADLVEKAKEASSMVG